MSPNANGKICYLEIPATDVLRSVEFYRSVFGWEIRKRGDGATAFDDSVGGVSGAWVTGRASSTQPGLLIYVMVMSLAATAAAIIAQGGLILEQSGADSPEKIARFADPDGNVLGLYEQPT